MAAVAHACRCLCNTDLGDEAQNAIEFDALSEANAPIASASPADLVAYSMDMGQPLRGKPLRSGELWFLRSEATAEKVTVALYVNGIAILHRGQEVRACFSPFILVRNCKFQDSSASNQLSALKIFKIFFYSRSLCYFFGVQANTEEEAEEERQSWVLDTAKVVHMVTQSLFPPYSISCEPVCAAAATARRLMAGYVIFNTGDDVATVLYGELSPHTQDTDMARLAFYENERCQKLAMEIYLAVGSNCFEKVGVNCSCFCINGHDFAARSIGERKLWLRAISNMKVKLQNAAPAPSREDIRHYREAIEDQIQQLDSSLESRSPLDALLARVIRSKRSRSRDRESTPPPGERSIDDECLPATPAAQEEECAPTSPSRAPGGSYATPGGMSEQSTAWTASKQPTPNPDKAADE